MKKLLSLMLAVVFLFGTALSLSSCDKNDEPEDSTVYLNYESDPTSNTVCFHVKNFGSIVIELYHEIAPITVANFLSLVDEGFYDGLTFHRIYAGFMIQGGDPNGDGTGGSENKIKGEFSANGVKNDLSHTRGVVSMARSSSYDSASSQFFICVDDASASLDGNYAAFGKVVEGMDTVDKIVEYVNNNLSVLKDYDYYAPYFSSYSESQRSSYLYYSTKGAVQSKYQPKIISATRVAR